MELYWRNGKMFRNTKKGTYSERQTKIAGSNIASHSWINDHVINFEDGQVIEKDNYRTRKTSESWHTAITAESDNNSKPLLPEQYRILLNKAVHMYHITLLVCSFIFHFLFPVEGYSLAGESSNYDLFGQRSFVFIHYGECFVTLFMLISSVKGQLFC